MYTIYLSIILIVVLGSRTMYKNGERRKGVYTISTLMFGVIGYILGILLSLIVTIFSYGAPNYELVNKYELMKIEEPSTYLIYEGSDCGCFDKSQYKFKYKDETGKIVIDSLYEKYVEVIVDSLFEKSKKQQAEYNLTGKDSGIIKTFGNSKEDTTKHKINGIIEVYDMYKVKDNKFCFNWTTNTKTYYKIRTNPKFILYKYEE